MDGDDPLPPGAGDIEAAADRISRWEARTRPLIIAAAVLPLVGAFSTGAPEAIEWVVAFGTWLVFLVDLVVHVRLAPRYLRTGTGLFDLFLVVTTFPWYLLGGGQAAGFTQILRLARLQRIAKVLSSSPLVRRFLRRLGRPVGYAAVMWVTCSLIVTRAEGPENGFTSIGAGLWWGIVTLTTVGYGDLTPKTPVGRVTGAVLMISGVALLGLVAASLASLFSSVDTADAPPTEVPERAVDPAVEDLRVEMEGLRAELRSVRELLDGGGARGDTPG